MGTDSCTGRKQASRSRGSNSREICQSLRNSYVQSQSCEGRKSQPASPPWRLSLGGHTPSGTRGDPGGGEATRSRQGTSPLPTRPAALASPQWNVSVCKGLGIGHPPPRRFSRPRRPGASPVPGHGSSLKPARVQLSHLPVLRQAPAATLPSSGEGSTSRARSPPL